jgi:hypothetical protein
MACPSWSGTWARGYKEGDIDRSPLPLRVLLTQQGFVIVHCHVSKLQLESVAGGARRAASRQCRVPAVQRARDASQCIMVGGTRNARAAGGAG